MGRVAGAEQLHARGLAAGTSKNREPPSDGNRRGGSFDSERSGSAAVIEQSHAHPPWMDDAWIPQRKLKIKSHF